MIEYILFSLSMFVHAYFAFVCLTALYIFIAHGRRAEEERQIPVAVAIVLGVIWPVFWAAYMQDEDALLEPINEYKESQHRDDGE